MGGLCMTEYRRVRLYHGRFYHHDQHKQYHHHQHSSKGGQGRYMVAWLAVAAGCTQAHRMASLYVIVH